MKKELRPASTNPALTDKENILLEFVVENQQILMLAIGKKVAIMTKLLTEKV